jgi:hypothetical protein
MLLLPSTSGRLPATSGRPFDTRYLSIRQKGFLNLSNRGCQTVRVATTSWDEILSDASSFILKSGMIDYYEVGWYHQMVHRCHFLPTHSRKGTVARFVAVLGTFS